MSIVKSFSVGNGDTFYIKHDSDSFTMIDCCVCEDDQEFIVDELKAESKGKGVTRFISTHPDDDHIRGLAYLDDDMRLLNFYCVDNKATKPDETDDFNRYCMLRDDSGKAFYLHKGCTRRWLNLGDEERGGAGINVIWPVTSSEFYIQALEKAKAGESFNNISIIMSYGLGEGVRMLWMGDLETDFMKKIKSEVTLDHVDVLFASHHGRDSGKVPKSWLDDMNPKIVIIGEAPPKHLNYYEGYNTITQNSAGDITFECVSHKVHIYVSDRDYSVDFLDDENMRNTYGKYIGTLNL
jgi:beta-lactamase superfamily II metal-dependent hydrolase